MKMSPGGFARIFASCGPQSAFGAVTSSYIVTVQPIFLRPSWNTVAIEMLYESLLEMTAAVLDLGVHALVLIHSCMSWMNPSAYQISVGQHW